MTVSGDKQQKQAEDSAPIAQAAAMPASSKQATTDGATAPLTRWQKIKKFIRLNMLALAVSSGIAIYFLFHYVTFLAPIKYPIKHLADEYVPWLIFIMLFIAFSKVEIRRMKPRVWHVILLGIQVLVPCFLAVGMHYWWQGKWDLELMGIIACVITPTAAAASVITGKLGGDESSLTTYTILSNIGAAISIPLIFPLISTSVSDSFWNEFTEISGRIFPIIVLPLFIAQFIRICIKPLNRFIITKLKDVGLYIWAFTLITVSATAVSNMMNSHQSIGVILNLAFLGLILTALQFGIGKFVGHLYGQRISAGQGLGQKNMVFGIWVTYSYLSPAATIAPGCYILWQNVVNSWQMWYRETRNITYTDKM